MRYYLIYQQQNEDLRQRVVFQKLSTVFYISSKQGFNGICVNSLFSDIVLSYKTVYGHFRKWSKNGEWESSWLHILEKNKSKLDFPLHLLMAVIPKHCVEEKRLSFKPERCVKPLILCI